MSVSSKVHQMARTHTHRLPCLNSMKLCCIFPDNTTWKSYLFRLLHNFRDMILGEKQNKLFAKSFQLKSIHFKKGGIYIRTHKSFLQHSDLIYDKSLNPLKKFLMSRRPFSQCIYDIFADFFFFWAILCFCCIQPWSAAAYMNDFLCAKNKWTLYWSLGVFCDSSFDWEK